jgi:CheY-like chemotaxis protein
MGKKVLIAEDYGDIRQMMKLLLEMYGYEALEAADGREAIEKAAEYHPDLILMDIMMPHLDGIEATRAIRKLEGASDIPIVAITAYDDLINDRAMAAGFTAVLSKPLFFDELPIMLDRFLKPTVKGHSGH